MTTQTRVAAKFFIGWELTADLRLLLNQSPHWKHLRILPAKERKFQQINYSGKEFIGWYLDQPLLSLDEVRLLEVTLVDQIKQAIPDVLFNPNSITLFAQTQVS